MLKQFEAKLLERIKRTSSIESFRFKVLDQLNFIPGQFVQIFNKYLSFSSSPTKDYFEITKRLGKSEFSGKLKNLRIGDTVLFKGPLGKCIFKDEDKQIAFLIGGIGITPVISIIEYIIDKKLDTEVVLLYSNRSEDIAFRRELDDWQRRNNKIKVLYLVSDCQPEDKSCLFGRISKDLITEKIDNWPERKVYIFGPPVMVEGLRGVCLGLGCRPQSLMIEKFIGY